MSRQKVQYGTGSDYSEGLMGVSICANSLKFIPINWFVFKSTINACVSFLRKLN